MDLFPLLASIDLNAAAEWLASMPRRGAQALEQGRPMGAVMPGFMMLSMIGTVFGLGMLLLRGGLKTIFKLVSLPFRSKAWAFGLIMLPLMVLGGVLTAQQVSHSAPAPKLSQSQRVFRCASFVYQVRRAPFQLQHKQVRKRFKRCKQSMRRFEQSKGPAQAQRVFRRARRAAVRAQR